MFRAFVRRARTPGIKTGFPRFKAKARFHAAAFRVGDGLTLHKSGRLGVVGVPSEIKVKWHRPLPEGARLDAAILTRQAGRWDGLGCRWPVAEGRVRPDGVLAAR